MQSPRRPVNHHNAYHAHVYFNDDTAALAKQLCDDIGDVFRVGIGRFHQRLVGPHRCYSCQITFTKDDFDEFIPWLDTHRAGLSVFVHGLTGDDLKDHTDYAYWLGDDVGVNTAIFNDT